MRFVLLAPLLALLPIGQASADFVRTGSCQAILAVDSWSSTARPDGQFQNSIQIRNATSNRKYMLLVDFDRRTYLTRMEFRPGETAQVAMAVTPTQLTQQQIEQSTSFICMYITTVGPRPG
ncbi:hypothetical protein [Roseococcus sp. YIM B11640]|uniref:hypothetical protein n=1 Tax=Roseococcus sp. YIM B11640 TaxID=3133973 RepID=UPI003C7C5D8B